MFEILKPLEPEYRCKVPSGSKYFHAYVHVCDYDFFLNPFKTYDSNYRVHKTTDVFIQTYSNWGYLYVPGLDIFVNKYGVLQCNDN